jgi:hypothetical protein
MDEEENVSPKYGETWFCQERISLKNIAHSDLSLLQFEIVSPSEE